MNSLHLRRSLLLLSTSISLLVLGCGDDEDAGAENEPAPSSGGTTSGGTTSGGTSGGGACGGDIYQSPELTEVTLEGEGDAVDEWPETLQMRFDDLWFVEPSPPIVNALNPIIVDNLNTELDYPINVLIELRDFDPQAGSASLFGGSGLKAGNGDERYYEWDLGEQSMEFAEAVFDPAAGRVRAELPALDLVVVLDETAPAEGEDPERSVLPIRELDVDLLMQEVEGVTRIVDGRLQGVILRATADDSHVTLLGEQKSLTEVLDEDTMNYDADGDCEADGWLLRAEFAAAPTEIR